MYEIWNAILALQFPVAQGYIIRPPDRHTSQGSEYVFSDLHVFRYRNNATAADKFLIVQCKRAGIETQDAAWEQAVDQLSRYLSATSSLALIMGDSHQYVSSRTDVKRGPAPTVPIVTSRQPSCFRSGCGCIRIVSSRWCPDLLIVIRAKDGGG